MHHFLVIGLLAGGCEPDTGDSAPPVDTEDSSDTGETGVPDDPKEIGDPVPSFALEDANPTSPTHGQVIDSADLLGTPYALVFLDSRCATCPAVADDLWATYEAHPGWWTALPLYVVQSIAAMELAPDTLDTMVENHPMPYLLDTDQVMLWSGLEALNHELFAVSETQTIDAYLPMYFWPNDLVLFTDYMTNRFGP